MTTYSVKSATCSWEQIRLFDVLLTVLIKLRLFYSDRIVYVCMTLACGRIILMGACLNLSCAIINVLQEI